MAGPLQFATRNAYPCPEALHEAKNFQGLRQIGIAVINPPELAEIVGRY